MNLLFGDLYTSLLQKGELGISYESDKDYFLSVVRYIYAWHAAGYTQTAFSQAKADRSFAELRSYARNKQDVDKYKTFMRSLGEADQKSPERNISWQTIPVLRGPRLRMIDKLQAIQPDLQPRTNDITSANEKATRLNRMKIAADPRTQGMAADNPYFNPELPNGIASQEDIDTYSILGGPTLEIEAKLKDLLDKYLMTQDTFSVLKMCQQDIVDLNFAAVHVNKRAGHDDFRIEYIDPANFVMRRTIYPDAHDVDYMGYLRFQTLKEVAEESNVTEEELIEIAQRYAGILNNPASVARTGAREQYVRDFSWYANRRVSILTLYFIVREPEKYVVGQHKTGSRIFDKVELDSRLDKRQEKKGKKIEALTIHKLYKCKWVVGTDMVYDYGLAEDVVYEKANNGYLYPQIPIVVFNGTEPSFIEDAIGLVDDIQIAVFKLRNTIRKMAPGPRMVLDKSRMAPSVAIGGKSYTILEMLQKFQEEGLFVVETISDGAFSNEQDNHRMRPFEFVPTGILEDIQALTTYIEQKKQELYTATNYNPVADGTNIIPDLLKGVMEGAQNATNSALMPMVRDYFDFYLRIGKFIKSLIQIRCVVPEGEIRKIFGNHASDIYLRAFSIDMKLVSPENKQMLMQMLMQMGNAIPPETSILITRAIEENDIARAQLLISKAVQAAKKEAQANEMTMLQAKSKAEAEAAIAMDQSKQQTAKLTSEQEVLALQEEYRLKMDLMQAEYDRKEEMLKMEGQIQKDTGIATAMANKTRF